MKEAEFKVWLEAFGANTPAGRNTRTHAVRTIEKNLAELGSPHGDLDAAWKADGFAQLRQKLQELKDDFAAGGTGFRVLMPESEKPENRLSSWRSWLGQYGRFLSGEMPGDRDADRIRQYVLEHYIEAARASDEETVEVLVRDVNTALNLNKGWPNICQALRGPKFLEMADVEAPTSIGADQSPATVFRFTLNVAKKAGGVARPFVLFDAAGAAFKPVKNFNRTTDRSAFRVKPAGASNKADEAIELDTIAEVARAMLVDRRPARVQSIEGGVVNYVAYGRQKLVRYELDPAIAKEIGVPPRGQIESGMMLDRGTLEQLRRLFIEKHADFRSFSESGSYRAAEDGYKRALVDQAAMLVAKHSGDQNADVGAALLDLVSGKGGLESNLLDWRVAKLVADIRKAQPGVIEKAAGSMVRETDAAAGIAGFVDELWPLLAENSPAKPYAESRTIPSMIYALANPTAAMGIRSTPTDNAAKMLLGRWVFRQQPLSGEEYVEVLQLARAIGDVMRDDWGWAPRDLWDVQGFIWETCQKRLPATALEQSEANEVIGIPMPQITNLILYGPPGTGKTFATAAEAVRLCNVQVPASREALMAEYQRLVASGQIEFVTFHQSYSYEEFVEGLRPVQGDGELSAGFQLKPEPGTFRRIARRAETSTGSGAENFIIGDRQVFKMSIGEASNPDDAQFFDEAIESGRTLLGFDDIDWSDSRFASRDAIIEACQAYAPDEPKPNAMTGRVQCPFIFRNWMKNGDLVIVSKGNSLFRAIGEVTGGYEYAQRESGIYSHRRAVRWLWIDRAGVPVEEIYARGFMMKSIYLLTHADLNVPALERYIASQQDTGGAAPESFVLVIDEINRANISKVFGELITLLEHDKRLGAKNELRVRLPYSREMFGVPANLHVVGTMNTADRSIALLDTALRRRFSFREIMPDPTLLPDDVEGINLQALLTTINERIEYLFDREHQIGHAYLMGAGTRSAIDDVMRDKVIPLLAEYFYEDWSKVAAVLGDAAGEGRFLDRVALKPPAGMDTDGSAETRYRWNVKRPFADNAYDQFG